MPGFLIGGRRGIRTPKTWVAIQDTEPSALRPSSHRTILYHKNKYKRTPLREFRRSERNISSVLDCYQK